MPRHEYLLAQDSMRIGRPDLNSERESVAAKSVSTEDTATNNTGGMHGKCGEKPPLSSNCKRRVLPIAQCHCPARGGKAQSEQCVASQETGSTRLMVTLSGKKETSMAAISFRASRFIVCISLV